jgi:hypothetical protein
LKRVLTTCALVLAIAVPIFSASSANAGQTVYRWTDDRGNPVNSDRPPPKGVDYEVISTSSSMVRPVDAEEGAVPLEVEPSPSNEFEPVDASPPKTEKNPEYCQRAKDNLETLDLNVRIQMRDEQGEVYFLTEEQRGVQRQKALDSINVNCD